MFLKEIPDRKKKQKENTIYAINLHFLDVFLKLNWLKTNLILGSSDVKVSLFTFIQLCLWLDLKFIHSNLQFLKKKQCEGLSKIEVFEEIV